MKIYVVTALDLVPWRAPSWGDAFCEIEDMRRRRKPAGKAGKKYRGEG